jgi:hypothetical protein
LSGTNLYTGATKIESGVLQLGNGGTTGSLSVSSVIEDNAIIAVVYRPRLYVIADKLRAPISGWDTDTGSLELWYREA